MKKNVLLTLLAVLMMSCSETTEELEKVTVDKSYTVEQEKTFDILEGSFQLKAKIFEGYEIEGEILTFSKRFAKPLEKSGFDAHGEGHSEDIVGKGAFSYNFYYYVDKGGLGLKIFDKSSTSKSPFKDCTMSIASKDKFTLFFKASWPGGGMDTYYRIK